MPELDWVKDARARIKREIGFGWSIRDHRGKVQLTRRFGDQRRSVQLPLDWQQGKGTKIGTKVFNYVDAISDLLNDQPHLGLQDACELAEIKLFGAKAEKAKDQQVVWTTVKTRFLATLGNLRQSSLDEWERRIDRLITALETTPKPTSGTEALTRYREIYFLGPNGEDSGPNVQMAPGGEGRTRNLKDAARFLRFAVDRCGSHSRWLPPNNEVVRELIGDPDSTTEQGEATAALKPEEFAQLLDDLKEEGKQELYVATALIGYLGLRPSELCTLYFDNDGNARVGAVKRNVRTIKAPPKPRLVLPVEIPGRDHEGERVLRGYQSGQPEFRLPKAIRTQIKMVKSGEKNKFKDIGATFRQQLERSKAWQKLLEINPDLVPYSLRHGFAWRATFGKDRMTPRVAAALMGHDPKTHNKHYGKWTDDESLLKEVQRINQAA